MVNSEWQVRFAALFRFRHSLPPPNDSGQMLTATNEGVRVHPASPIHRGRPVMRANARLILLLSKHAIPLAQDGRLSKLGFCATEYYPRFVLQVCIEVHCLFSGAAA